MISDHQRDTSRLVPVPFRLQASFPRCIEHSLDLFIQVLLVISPCKKVMFEFTGSVFKVLFLRANASEAERLAKRNGSLTVYRVATVHAKVLVFVRGLNMQVRLDSAVF